MKAALGAIFVGMLLAWIILWKLFGLTPLLAAGVILTAEICKGICAFGFPSLWFRIKKLTGNNPK